MLHLWLSMWTVFEIVLYVFEYVLDLFGVEF